MFLLRNRRSLSKLFEIWRQDRPAAGINEGNQERVEEKPGKDGRKCQHISNLKFLHFPVMLHYDRIYLDSSPLLRCICITALSGLAHEIIKIPSLCVPCACNFVTTSYYTQVYEFCLMTLDHHHHASFIPSLYLIQSSTIIIVDSVSEPSWERVSTVWCRSWLQKRSYLDFLSPEAIHSKSVGFLKSESVGFQDLMRKWSKCINSKGN